VPHVFIDVVVLNSMKYYQ